MPQNLCIIILESLLFQGVMSMFVPKRSSYQNLWDKAAAYSTLIRLNPQGEECLIRSPFVAGQYRLYHLVHKVMMLFLSPNIEAIQTEVVSVQSEIQQIRLGVKQDFDQTQFVDLERQNYLSDTYDLFCICLMFCAVIMEKPTRSRDWKYEALISEALHKFFSMPIVQVNHIELLWPIQILACALTGSENFQILLHRFESYKPLLDVGPRRRFNALVSRIIEVSTQSISENERKLRPIYSDSSFPRGMLLLRQEDGVLSHEF